MTTVPTEINAAAVKNAVTKNTAEKLTPMMAQYMGIKEQHPDMLVF